MIDTLELASPEAGKVALRGGSADIVVSDWTWVSRERTLGARLTLYPYSTALGAIMLSPGSPIRNLTDLRGKSLAVAGGPIDKSWLFVRAALMQEGLNLQSDAKIAYGAPPCWRKKPRLASSTRPSITGISALAWRRAACAASPRSPICCRSSASRGGRR